MSKVLKTGDVKRYPRSECPEVSDGDAWATVFGPGESCSRVWGWWSRRVARKLKRSHGRIARILSIGPKLVTVRIEK